MLNWIFLVLIGASVLTAAFNGTMGAVTAAGINSAKAAVELAIGLVGQMALWLGFMGILREAGLMRSIARALQPVMKRLFPDVPADHPAMGAMIMNMSANMLGLANAATPFGLKAMAELDKLNTRPGIATNAMVLFLTINTSGVAVLPLGAVAVRATVGSNDPAGIILPSILATLVSTLAGITVVKLLERRGAFAPERYGEGEVREVSGEEVKGLAEAEKIAQEVPPASGWRAVALWALVAAVAYALVRHFLAAGDRPAFDVSREILSDWLLPLLMLVIVALGMGRRVRVYEVFVSSAKEGFQIAVMIIPFLVAILVAIGMFRASGAMDWLVSGLSPARHLGFPPEALPMALIRPLSGSGALAVMTELMRTYGPDSFVGYLVSILNGSTETTFYVLAVYFGSVQVRVLRHSVASCLSADFVGVIAATAMTHLFFA